VENEMSPSNQNPFDPSALALSQNFSEMVGVKKAVVTIPVRKPNRQEFIRVHPDLGYQVATAVLELKEERETYLVAQDVIPEISLELAPKLLVATTNRQGVLSIWPIRLPGVDGKIDDWNRSAMEAAGMARKGWVRMAANMSLGAYDIFEAIGNLPDPEWPEIEFSKILEIAFRDKYIDSLNHPVLQRLRGEA
jgi:hypothetical protein